MNRKRKYIFSVGDKIGRLTLLENFKKNIWTCKCECGGNKIAPARKLALGIVKSCGCLHEERMKAGNVKHGFRHTQEYHVWSSLRDRCKNPRCKAWKNYGGRGIRVCAGWDTFAGFQKTMGERPFKHSVDRIDNDKNYSCGKCEECLAKGWELNVRWASQSIQCRNNRRNIAIEFNGEKRCLAEWCEQLNLGYKTTRARLMRGWSPAKAFTQPVAAWNR